INMLNKSLTLIVVIMQFIASVLLSFLVLGCIDTSKRYSDNFLLQYQFNNTSPLFQHLNTTGNSTISKTDAFRDIKVSVSYYGVCLKLTKGQFNCTNYNSLRSFPDYSIAVVNKTKLDLVQLAHRFSSVCHPKVLLATILLSLVALLLLCYVVIPSLPGKFQLKKGLVGLTGFTAMFWGIGAMLQHQAVSASTVIIREGSMGLIKTEIGKRAESITWVSFGLDILVFGGVMVDFVTEYKSRRVSGPPAMFAPGKV
ncbi:uncharacterized protein SPAPADRAFT_143339, partial [Spathaspora passalidarum NRRL Y-27907]